MNGSSFRRFFFLFLAVLGFFLFIKVLVPSPVIAADCIDPKGEKDLTKLTEIQDACLKGLSELQGTEDTLTKAISYMQTQERLTKVKISQTSTQIVVLEGEIASLSAKIVRLDESLNYISKIFLSRIIAGYKMRLVDPLMLFFTSRNLGDFLARYQYLKSVQLHDRSLLLSMEETKMNYDDQKKLKETLQAKLLVLKKQLEAEKASLVSQITSRNQLLQETRGREADYQKFLQATKEELEAIQQIAAGNGEEKEIGRVDQGQRIAGIIYGASPCSTGTHLHFEVRDSGQVKNPFDYLKNISLVDLSGGDPHQGNGDWDWPLSEPIKLNQGFGQNTAAIRSRIVWYNFHTGIDLNADDLTIKSVKTGTLFRGAVKCGGGTLRYVKVRHEGSSIETYYLHVNY